MKLDRADAPHAQPLAPEDWTMEVLFDGEHCCALVSRHGQMMCRLSATHLGLSESQARTALAERARAWIADYLSRTHTGHTSFGAL